MNAIDLLVLKQTTVILGTLGSQLASNQSLASKQVFDLVRELGRIIGENQPTADKG